MGRLFIISFLLIRFFQSARPETAGRSADRASPPLNGRRKNERKSKNPRNKSGNKVLILRHVETRKRPAKQQQNNWLQTKSDFLPPIGFIRWPPVTSPETFFQKKKNFPPFSNLLLCNRFLLLSNVQSSAEKKKMTRTAGAQCDAAPLRSAAPPSENQLETLWPRIGRRVPYFGPFKQQTRPLLSTAEQITWFVIFAAIFVVWKKEKRAVRWLFISGPPKNNSCG